MMIGKLLDLDDMPPVGTKVVFKGYRVGRHKHWGFQVGETYCVNKGYWPPANFDNDFIFELAEFTKSDLKDGMRIELKQGDELIFLTRRLIKFRPSLEAVSLIEHYSDDLAYNVADCQRWDIVKVTDRDGTVLFEREEEPRELTIEEIAKAFNLPVERVRIKK